MALFRARIPEPFFLRRSSAICTGNIIAPSSPPTDQNKKPLHLLFQEAVGFRAKPETDIETETQSNEVKKKLWELEREIRHLKEAEPKNNTKVAQPKKTKSLYGLFTGKEIAEKVETERKKLEGPLNLKELSPDMKMFVNHLYNEGYFTKANFFRNSHIDFSCFNDSYGRDFIKFAVEMFAKDHQEIAKWLSGSDLKKVALFGCPSLAKKNVFSAKRLRKYLEIQEDIVCNKCVLRHSCKFVNQSVWNSDYKTLNLVVLMRVITLYALELAHPDLPVPDEIKGSVRRLLKEILKLSQTTS
ncbi:uncharacterized protein LOC8275917 isoform X1 [Ricinus communis]|uniref:Uncharacterized protein n=1 Tax=Ricinus communis TaxID=3988 RepID=B9SEV3_RICCO|nr:uncharacterized protein LOC8275917 isoform X1 [Ricinus communis]EEF37849.1 protein with unknown function [Ricinus communis]|eukprot:XP_002524522.1 uncharacterized protein LOC8275917 [Ricinus communis]